MDYDMTLTPFEEIEDMVFGKRGTPKREAYEAQLAEEMMADEVSFAMRKAREELGLTKEELAERVGMSKAKISSIERGKGITIQVLYRVSHALGLHPTLTLESNAQ